MKKVKWIIGVIALILFFLIVRSVYIKDIIKFDSFCYNYIALLISDKATFFVKVITSLGSALPLIAITMFILLIFKNKIYGILTGINLISVFLFNFFLKAIFARPRPIDINIIKESGYSFPSGHAMVSTAFYGFLIYLIWKTNTNSKQKWLYTILLSILVIFICITRIYLGVHYTSDVLGGFLIAITYLMVYTSISSKYLNKK